MSLGALAAGRYSFDMTGFSTFKIAVSKNAAVAWTQISSTRIHTLTSNGHPE